MEVNEYSVPIENFKKKVNGKPVAVVGIGVSNVPLIKFLVGMASKVTAYDRRTKEQLGDTYSELSALGVSFILGDSYLDKIDDDIKLYLKLQV